MKKLFLFSIVFFTYFNNTFSQKGIDALIQAEKNFAAFSVNHSTKEAFLKFLDSTGIVFENGKPVNGIEAWNKREKRPGVLNWHPQFAEIAESGDFGYTTGPWTFQNSSNDSIAARGQYTTVWHIDKNGEWKFIVDLGVGNTPPNTIRDVKKIDVAKLFSDSANSKERQVIDVEKNFLKSVSKNSPAAYKKYLSAESIVNRNGYLPATSSVDQQKLISTTPSSVQ